MTDRRAARQLAPEVQAAMGAHERAGRPDLAARLARQAGDSAGAALLYERASMPFDAGVCHFDAGDPARALQAFTSIPSSSSAYRGACQNAIHVAVILGTMTFEFDGFIAPYARTAPGDAADLAALYQLGVLYQTNDYEEDARELFAVVARVDAGYRDVRERLLKMEAGQRDLGQLLRSDAAFWRPSSSPPDLQSGADLPRTRAQTVPPPTSTGARKVERTQGSAPAPNTTLAEPPTQPSDQGLPTEPRTPPSKKRKRPQPGDLVASRYLLGGVLGRGGMSTVYQAFDQELRMDVALKVCHDGQYDDTSLLARFKQELMISRELNHPTIIRLYDIGDHEGSKFISMELLAGSCLRDLIGTIDLARGVYCLHQLAVALSVVHEAGIVHRDVKPANVFVTRHDTIKLMDFGIAKRRTKPDEAGLTATGFVAGTVGYMAPEQYAHFATVGAAADIYALGVVGFESFTGQKLFNADSSIAVLHEQLNGVRKGARSIVPAVPEALDSLLLRMVAREPEDRPASCEEIAAELYDIANKL